MSLLDRAARYLDDVLLLPEDLRAALDAAERALEAGAFVDAERRYRAVLEQRPQLARALIGWTRALVGSGDVAAARVALAEARVAAPDDPQLPLLAGRLALQAGELGAAAAGAREAARRLTSIGGGPLADACTLRGEIELKRQRPDRAAREFRKALAAAPDRPSIRVALIESLVAAGEAPMAMRVAREVAPASLGAALSLRLGLALEAGGAAAEAVGHLDAAAQQGDASALAALARIARRQGDSRLAETRARMAIARGGGPPALVLLAEILEQRGPSAEAAHALVAAAEATRDPDLVARAARVIPLTEAVELSRVADALERASGDAPPTRALRAWALYVRGERSAACELVRTLEGEPRARLLTARAALDDRDTAAVFRALDALDGMTLGDADRALAAALRREALRLQWRGPEGDVDLAAAIDSVARFASHRGLAVEERRARDLRDELDRPLLLAILGEFNAGKSTLVNAFLGADVAPTGILPTTATLNVLRAGAERRVRVVRRDGTTREGGHEDVRALLDAAEAEGAAVDRVEIVLPSELLDRIWILDTPGSNAPNPEHEALAQEALRRADVALWIFDAGQAGKATEGRILAGIRESKREVVAALNKVDRLRPDELARVETALYAAMPELNTRAVPLSARKALKARLAGDDAAYAESGFPALLAHLEEHVFARSRPLKRRACAGRLISLLTDALATEASALAEPIAERAAAESARTKVALHLEGEANHLDPTLARVEAGQDAAILDAAKEVLAFVRPHAGRFGTHDADAEDRLFLVELLEARLDVAFDLAATELVMALSQALIGLAPQLVPAHVEAEVRAALLPAFADCAGLQRGSLQATVRRFFDEQLRTLTLTEPNVAEALAPMRIAPRDVLRPLLERAFRALGDRLTASLEAHARSAKSREEDLVRGTFEPLRALLDVLDELVR